MHVINNIEKNSPDSNENSKESSSLSNNQSYAQSPNGKKTSKIALKLDMIKQIVDEDFNRLYQIEEEEKTNNLNGYEDCFGPQVNLHLSRSFIPPNSITITANVILQINKEEKIYSFPYAVSEDTTMSTFISNIILKFNLSEYEITSKKNLIIQLNPISKNYVIKAGKKSGKPNNDYPPFNYNCTIKDAYTTKFCLIVKEKDINLIITRDSTQKSRCSDKCCIF